MSGERGDCYASEMTIREKIAAMAMQGMLSNQSIIDQSNCKTAKWIAEHAEIHADALLAELAKPQEVAP